MMKFLTKTVAVIGTLCGLAFALMGGLTWLQYMIVLAICWIGVPLFTIIVLPCLIGLVAWLWSR